MDTSDIIDLVLGIGVPVIFLSLGLSIGTITERRHLRNLERRRGVVAGLLLTDLRSFPGGTSVHPAGGPMATLVVAEVVISSDYMRSFLARLKKIFGGELGTYHRLMMRARAEAQMRVAEQAMAGGYDAVCNLRFETVDVSGVASGGGRRNQQAAMASIIASGTAYRTRRAGGDNH